MNEPGKDTIQSIIHRINHLATFHPAVVLHIHEIVAHEYCHWKIEGEKLKLGSVCIVILALTLNFRYENWLRIRLWLI